MDFVDTPYSELDFYVNYLERPPIIGFLDMVTKELRIAWGARTIDVDSHRVFERDTPRARAIKIIISIVIAPITLIVIICFLIKMAVSASLQHRATIEGALNNSQARIEELRVQFFSLHNQGRSQEALSLVERNEGFLRGQSDILAIVTPSEEVRLSETPAASPIGDDNTAPNDLREQFFRLMDDSKNDEAFALYDANPILHDLDEVSIMVNAYRSVAANNTGSQVQDNMPTRPARAFDAWPMFSHEMPSDTMFDIEHNATTTRLRLCKQFDARKQLYTKAILVYLNESGDIKGWNADPSSFIERAEGFISYLEGEIPSERNRLIVEFQNQVVIWTMQIGQIREENNEIDPAGVKQNVVLQNIEKAQVSLRDSLSTPQVEDDLKRLTDVVDQFKEELEADESSDEESFQKAFDEKQAEIKFGQRSLRTSS